MITVHIKSHLMETSRSFDTDALAEKYLKQIKKHHDKHPDVKNPQNTRLIVNIDSTSFFNQL